MMFSYLSGGRNTVQNKKESKISFEFDQLISFEKEYDQFLLELKEDDELHGIEDEIFASNNYPSWGQVLSHQKNELLKVALNDYLFEAFFEMVLKVSGGSTKYFITDIVEVEIKDKLFLRVLYIEK